MKPLKMSLAAVVAAGICSGAFASDDLLEAIKSTSLDGTIYATIGDKEDDTNAYDHENFFGFRTELGVQTGDFYGLSAGATAQAWTAPGGMNKQAQRAWQNEFAAKGVVFSQGYLQYKYSKTAAKFGRQYYYAPLVAGNDTRAFKEAWEGLTFESGDLNNHTFGAAWFYKFQGRSQTAIEPTRQLNRAPSFTRRVILSGVKGNTREFDNIFSAHVISQAVPNLKVTLSAARADGVKAIATPGSEAESTVNLFYAEGNYKIPFDGFNLMFDAMYKGSRTSGELSEWHVDGDMFNVRAGIGGLYGFSANYAYSWVSSSDQLIAGLGNGPGSYTALPIRGPYFHSTLIGAKTHKVVLGYNFDEIGLKGLKTFVHLMKSDAPTLKYDVYGIGGPGTVAGTSSKASGYSLIVAYNMPYINGLTLSATYTSFARKRTLADGSQSRPDIDEVWLQAIYKFKLL